MATLAPWSSTKRACVSLEDGAPLRLERPRRKTIATLGRSEPVFTIPTIYAVYPHPMGNSISAVRYAFHELLDTARIFKALSERIDAEPGLPLEHPTRSFWMHPPSPIAQHCSPLPHYADVVVIGSGITGTSFSRTLIDRFHAEGKKPPVLLMLDARDACSGATGRNGGHISPSPYNDFATFRKIYGDATAYKIVKFRLAHLQELRRAAEEEGVLEQSQWRQVETVDAYFNQKLFARAKEEVEAFANALPSEASHHRVYETVEASEKFNFAPDVAGCIASVAGAIHPYNFVTGILSNLLKRYPENFLLCTNTPCTSVTGPSKEEPLYTIITPKGLIKTHHVIHATNGWSSQLLTPMRSKIIPFRGNVTAQRPGQSIPAETLQRSFIFYEMPIGYDYLTRLPNGEREFILGGGFLRDGREGHEAVANTDDRTCCKSVCMHLGGSLPRYFGEDSWGREGQPPEMDAVDTGAEWSKGRVKATWSGILGISADLLPWVGRLPPSVSGRPTPSNPRSREEDAAIIPTASGEWIAAGYTGEGMVQAWMSGKALAEMVLGGEREENLAKWFPDVLRVSTDRWKKTDWATTLIHYTNRD